MATKLYWFPISHPAHAARKMLELKGVPYELVHVLPGNQRIHLRAAGFRGGTVPALKLDGQRIQGLVDIGHELDKRYPDPPLYPADAAERARFEDIERWADTELQMVPRRVLRWALTRDAGLRKWVAENDGSMPAPAVASRITGPVSRYYAWVVGADKERARQTIADLPSTLDRIDQLMDERIVTPDQPNAVTLQVLCTVRSLLGFEDFEEQVGARKSAEPARRLFPDFPEAKVPAFVGRLGVG